MSLWAEAVAGSARNLQRRREMGWKYRETVGQSTAALYAAEQAERRRQRNRHKTQAITAVIVLGVTVPAWAVVNAVSTPSAHNGLATVSDGAPLAGPGPADGQLGRLLDTTQHAAPALTDDRSDVAWAKTMSTAHQFDLPWATDQTTAPAPVAPVAKRAPVAHDEPAPDDLPDDAVITPGEAGTAPEQSAPAPEPAVAPPDHPATVTLPGHDRDSLDREGAARKHEHEHEQSRPVEATKPALPAPAAPVAPADSATAGDPADPTRNATTTTVPQTPTRPAAPVTPAKPAAGDPAAPPATSPRATTPASDSGGGATTPTSDSGGGATRGEGKAADSKPAHGHVAKSDPAAP
jgi:hypothetical protein